MPVLKRSMSERDPVKVAIIGILVLAVLGMGIFNAGSLFRALTSNSYTAQFTDVGGLQVGDDVRLAGAQVGEVSDIRIDGDVAAVDFTAARAGHLGDATGASIKSGSVVGKRYLALLPAGTGELESGSTIPVARTQAPYDITQALSGLTNLTAELNKPQLVAALDTVSETMNGTGPDLRSALDGVNRLSQTIASRDDALRNLLGNANGVTGLLAQRSGQLVTLMTDGNLLLNELDQRRAVIQSLLVNVTETINQLNGLVSDNEKQLGPALDELKGVLDLLNRQSDSLGAVIHGLNFYAGSLGESIGAGPWFYALVSNLPPTNLAPALPTLLGTGR